MLKEFRDFAMKGNVVDLAIGVIIGAAFGRIVSSLVDDVIMPFIGAIGGADFSNYYIPLSTKVVASNLADAKKQGPVFRLRQFHHRPRQLSHHRLRALPRGQGHQHVRKMAEGHAKAAAAADPPKPSDEVVLLTEIRDALVKR